MKTKRRSDEQYVVAKFTAMGFYILFHFWGGVAFLTTLQDELAYSIFCLLISIACLTVAVGYTKHGVARRLLCLIKEPDYQPLNERDHSSGVNR